jgi:osmoprotectant transport system permease protein
MNLVLEVLAWFADPDQWQGRSGIPTRLVEHLTYTVQAVVIAAVIAVPLGGLVGHTGRGGFLLVGIANGLRALPELGLLILLVLLTGIGVLPLTITLVVLAIPPLLAGTYAGIRNTDPAVVDAARGVGMREGDVLMKVEFPIALPLMIAGLRTATLQVIATAAIGAYTRMAGGAVLIALLALVVEGLLAALQRLVVSPGLRAVSVRTGTRRPTPVVAGGTA